VFVFSIVPVAIVRSSSVETAIGETCIAPAVALSKAAERHYAEPDPVTVQHAGVALLTPLASIGSVHVNNKK